MGTDDAALSLSTKLGIIVEVGGGKRGGATKDGK